MVVEKKKVLACDVEARKTWEEVEEQFCEELSGRWSLERPDLFGFACGVVVDVETGKAGRFGSGDSEQMLMRLEEADLIVTGNEIVSELGVLGVPFDSTLREKHLNLVVEYELEGTDGFVWYGKGEDGAVLFAEGRIEEALDLSELRARWTAEAYRAVRHLHTGSPKFLEERDDSTWASRDLWNIKLGFAWGQRKPY